MLAGMHMARSLLIESHEASRAPECERMCRPGAVSPTVSFPARREFQPSPLDESDKEVIEMAKKKAAKKKGTKKKAAKKKK
jgi:hypothetical protein